MKTFFVKVGLYTLVFLIVTALLSDELSCILTLDDLCMTNFIGKYLIFLVAMFLFDKFMKPFIFKNNSTKT